MPRRHIWQWHDRRSEGRHRAQTRLWLARAPTHCAPYRHARCRKCSGLLTTTSRLSASGTAVRISVCTKSTLALSDAAFSFATASASAEMSNASTSGQRSANASEMAIQPLPVPMSSTRRSAAPPASSVIISTSNSVSGRGIRVAGVTLNSCPWKRA